MKLEFFILGGQIIDQKRKKGWGERGLRKGAEEQSEDREEKETKGVDMTI